MKNQNRNLSYPYGIIESVANVFTSNLLNDCSFSNHIIFCIDLYIWGSYFFVVTYQTSHGDDFVFEDSSLTSTTCTVMPTNSNRATVLRSNQVFFCSPILIWASYLLVITMTLFQIILDYILRVECFAAGWIHSGWVH